MLVAKVQRFTTRDSDKVASIVRSCKREGSCLQCTQRQFVVVSSDWDVCRVHADSDFPKPSVPIEDMVTDAELTFDVMQTLTFQTVPWKFTEAKLKRQRSHFTMVFAAMSIFEVRDGGWSRWSRAGRQTTTMAVICPLLRRGTSVTIIFDRQLAKVGGAPSLPLVSGSSVCFDCVCSWTSS